MQKTIFGVKVTESPSVVYTCQLMYTKREPAIAEMVRRADYFQEFSGCTLVSSSEYSIHLLYPDHRRLMIELTIHLLQEE